MQPLLQWKSNKYYILCVCVCVALGIQHAVRSAVLYFHLWAVRLHNIFPRYLINSTIFGKKLWNIKCVFLFSLQLLCEIFIILRRSERAMIINVYRSSYKVSVILVMF